MVHDLWVIRDELRYQTEKLSHTYIVLKLKSFIFEYYSQIYFTPLMTTKSYNRSWSQTPAFFFQPSFVSISFLCPITFFSFFTLLRFRDDKPLISLPHQYHIPQQLDNQYIILKPYFESWILSHPWLNMSQFLFLTSSSINPQSTKFAIFMT